MATRRERVVLELEDGLSGPITRDAAAVALLKRELNDLDRTSVRTGRSLSTDATRGVKSVGDASGKAEKDIDRFSGRLRLVADLATVLGPGLVPIGAVGIPALAGLANMMAFSAAGAGTLALAMVGVGDTLKSVREAELEPSAANLAEMQQKLSDLSPAARNFVLQLDDMLPRLTKLRDAAAQGAMPGLSRALDEFDQQIPETSRLIYEMADAVGDLAAEGVESLGSERWADFFDFMQGEARPAMQSTAHVTGDLVHALAELWMAFDPTNDDFAAWLEKQASAIDDWATGLDQTQGFEDFLQYIRETGPQVADTLGSVGNAAIQVLEAAAPLGGPVLKGLELVFDGLAKLADSPIGPSLFGAAAALTVLNRTLQATGGILTRMGFTGAASSVTGKLAAGGPLGVIGSGARTLSGDLRAMITPLSAAERASTRAGASFNRQSAAAARLGKAAAGGAAGIGAMALLSTDAGREMGLTNTAMLGLAGSMAGPWGAAVGSAVGLTLDFAAAAGKAEDAQSRWNNVQADNTTNFAAYGGILQDARDEFNAYRDDIMSSNIGEYLGNTLDPDVWINFAQEAFGATSELEQMEKALNDLERQQERNRTAAQALGSAFGQDIGRGDDAGLQGILERSAPAMSALGYSVEDLANASPDELRLYADVIADWTKHADTAAGRTDAFAKSVEDLGNDALSTADSAAQMGAALDALLSPTLNAEEATDAWRASLKELQKELKSKAGFQGFTKGAMENRQMTRDYVTDSMSRLTALAGLSTTTEGDMARAVAQTRQEFIKSGVAAGFSREQMVKRANALKLTPKLVKTVFEAAGITEVDLRARRLRETFKGLPKKVQTELRAEGIPQTTAQVDRLVEKYHLTEKQRQALISLKDLASKDIGNILDKLHIVDNTHPTPKITVQSNAADIAAQTAAILNNLDDETVYIHTVRTGPGGQGAGYAGPAGADGMTVPGLRRPYGDKVFAHLAPGEEVISNRFGQADRHRQLLKAINANRYADGGTVNGWAGRSSSGGSTHRTERVERVVEQLPRTIVLDAGDLGRMVIDTVEGKIVDADLMNAEIGRAR